MLWGSRKVWGTPKEKTKCNMWSRTWSFCYKEHLGQLVKLGCWLWIRQSYCISFKFHKYGNLIVVMWGGHHYFINIYLVLMSNAGWCRQLTLMVQNKQVTYIFSYENDKSIRAVWQNVKNGWVQIKGNFISCNFSFKFEIIFKTIQLLFCMKK